MKYLYIQVSNGFDLVEIDEMVIQKCKKYLPTISYGLDSKKVNVHIADGVKFVGNTESDYDIVIIDSTDPIGSGEALFTKSFYQNVFSILCYYGSLSRKPL